MSFRSALYGRLDNVLMTFSLVRYEPFFVDTAKFSTCAIKLSARRFARVATSTNCSSVKVAPRGRTLFTNVVAFSFPSQSSVGSCPANRQMCPTVGAFAMSIWANSPADMTGPIPRTVSAH